MKFRLTIDCPGVTPGNIRDLLANINVTSESITMPIIEGRRMLMGLFTADTGQNAQYGLQNIVNQLQNRVLEHYGRYLVTARGTAIAETPVEYSNDWIILTDDQRAQRFAENAERHTAKLAAEKAKLIAKLRTLKVAKVQWSVYWENDQNECEDTTLLDAEDNDISDQEEYGGSVYDELLDYYEEAIDEDDDIVTIDTGSYELRLIDDDGKEIEELHFTGSYVHGGGW